MRSRISVASALAVLLFLLLAVAAPARADWNAADPFKWLQPPDLINGMDVNATFRSIPGQTQPEFPYIKVLADDFLCTSKDPVTDVHIWGSWLYDRVNPDTVFKLSFHEDVPAPPPPTTIYSHPGPEIWSHIFSPGDYKGRIHFTASERFYEPNTNTILGTDTQVWQYNFNFPEHPFPQEGSATNPKVYWLDVQALVPGDEVFGWKTSIQHWNDDAVFGDTEFFGGPPDYWRELRIPPVQGQSYDMAFVITPEPGTTVMLFGAGALCLIGCACRRWRKRS